MTRVTGGPSAHARHRRTIRRAKGYYGRRKNTYRTAIQAVERAAQYAYRDRRRRKRDFRALWIQRVNAAARLHGTTYGRLIAALKAMECDLDRKMLADLAARDPDAFAALAERAREAKPSATS